VTDASSPVPADSRGLQPAVDSALPTAPAAGAAESASGHKIGMWGFLTKVVTETSNTVRFLVIVLVLSAIMVTGLIVTSKFATIDIGPVRIGQVGATALATIITVQLVLLASRIVANLRPKTSMARRRSAALHLVRS
jgi:uncharacterized RDD family membrane protein YckC